jgi:hypothetical protein
MAHSVRPDQQLNLNHEPPEGIKGKYEDGILLFLERKNKKLLKIKQLPPENLPG